MKKCWSRSNYIGVLEVWLSIYTFLETWTLESCNFVFIYYVDFWENTKAHKWHQFLIKVSIFLFTGALDVLKSWKFVYTFAKT